jgi:hypothetical protein
MTLLSIIDSLEAAEARMTKEPSEATMRVALEIVERWVREPASEENHIAKLETLVALALDHHAAVQRERAAQEVEKIFREYVWCGQVAAAIRSASC